MYILGFIKAICFVFILFLSLVLNAQEIPPIQVFSPNDYKADDQNWDITQSDDNFIYIANNAGLLEYNGARWTLYKSPNNDILRSVKSVEDKIYSGGYMDFGFWTKDKFGKLNYESLVKENKISVKDDEEFWDIIRFENYMLFQSFERIYIYNVEENSVDVINSEARINKVFLVNESIYFQKINEGLFKIVEGKAELVVSSAELNNYELINLFPLGSDLLLQTQQNGFFSYVNGVVEKWKTDSDDFLDSISVYSSIKLKSGGFVLGTISNGVVLLNEDGSLIQKIEQIDGLSNNTILSIKEDSYGNIWLGLDNGIDVINLSFKYRVFIDERGILGTVYTSIIVDNILYLGTNQGLFYKTLDSNEKFQFLEGTKGQVWSLAYLKGTLFCGHDEGTFVIKSNSAKKISTELGAWIIKPIEGRDNLLLQGNYNGLNVLELKNGEWSHRNKISGYGMSSRFIEFYYSNKILVNHEYKGIYKIKLDEDFRKVIKNEKINIEQGLKSSLVTYNGSVLYSYKNGVFRFNRQSEIFEMDSTLSRLFTGNTYVSGKLIYEEDKNRLWGFTKENIIYVEPGISSGKPEINVIEISDAMRKIKTGFENIMQVNNDKYLIGNSEGYIILDISEAAINSYEVSFNEVSYSSLHNEFISLDYMNETELRNKQNNLHFSYSVPNYNKLVSSKYQYKLIGIYDNWSNWSSTSEVTFDNLPHGDYEFKVRAKVGSVVIDNFLSYKFSIEKPWYLKPLAIVSYIILGLSILFIIHFLNKSYYKKQKEKVVELQQRELEMKNLETQRQLVQFKNQNLRLDIENKNRELGAATMNLVKRNELLNTIKDELNRSKTADDVKRVIRMINTSLNSTNDWKLFEEAFNNVDKDFMKKIKKLHPSITSNDLRLCAYLRLNLSSKEIAPLLNISHKSVEVKRYRLRKKMGLDHDQSLADYILKV